jgi:hypothetical protein
MAVNHEGMTLGIARCSERAWSLATPRFTEGVRWIVLAPPIDVSPAQMAEFGALFPEGHAREVQALKGRTIPAHDRHFVGDDGIGSRE